MPCEHYKKVLIEGAASNDLEPLPLDLRTHLDSCASCRIALDDERRLLAAIDSGLRAAASSIVPPSLLPTVHLRMAQEDAASTITKRSPSANWIYLAAAAALVLALLPLLRPRNAHEPLAQSQTDVAISSAAVGVGLEPGQPSATNNPAAQTEAQTQTKPGPTIARSASSRTRSQTPVLLAQYGRRQAAPEVIVPADERIALAKFLSRPYGRKSLTAAPVNSSSEPQAKALTIDPLQIAQLEVQSLEEQHRQAESEIQTR